MSFSFQTGTIQPCLVGGLTLLTLIFSANARPPNFVVILTDDQGYADAGCYGARDFETPHLDRMAADGLRLTHFYSAASTCSASRAALLTGRYPDRIGVTEDFSPVPAENGRPASHGKAGLPAEEFTIAEILRNEGYATACIGKWHLGDHPDFLPTKQGFDRYFGIPYSNDLGWWQGNPADFNGHLPPIPVLEGERILETNPDQRLLTKRYTEHAVKFIRENKGKPFFLLLAHSMPHFPLFASERFSGSARYGLYGDVIQEIDWSVGVILRALEQENAQEDTLVIFTSDNGPALEQGAHGGKADPLKDGKFTRYDGGHRVPCLIRWPGKLEAGRVVHGLASTVDLLPTFAGLAGAKLPADRQIDGVDLWPYLSGKMTKSPRDTFFYSPWVVRREKWKLLMPGKYRETVPVPSAGDGMITYDHSRLFDLSNDPGETENLGGKSEHEELIRELTELCTRYQMELTEKTGPDESTPSGRE